MSSAQTPPVIRGSKMIQLCAPKRQPSVEMCGVMRCQFGQLNGVSEEDIAYPSPVLKKSACHVLIGG
jgi:hypothetical protein